MTKETRAFYTKMAGVFVHYNKNNFLETLFIKFIYDSPTDEQPFDYRWGPGPLPVFEEED